ncbi:hypothetical protein [Hyphomicrobium sp. ghe19]|uniref:hypothetical protein n=1 Tax=Hyphomicrobium sp. ghe19 TaxID=2682968 RepID=UPI0013672C48|nr:hypothetical protein HYPP_02604 [Hyphomicrobium sp. ghe19]
MDIIKSLTAIEQQALKELAEENFREAVEAVKAKLREKKPWWHRLLPFTVTVKWRT